MLKYLKILLELPRNKNMGWLKFRRDMLHWQRGGEKGVGPTFFFRIFYSLGFHAYERLSWFLSLIFCQFSLIQFRMLDLILINLIASCLCLNWRVVLIKCLNNFKLFVPPLTFLIYCENNMSRINFITGVIWCYVSL